MSRCRPSRRFAGFGVLSTPAAGADRARAIMLALGAIIATTLSLAPFAHASLTWSAPQDLSAAGLDTASADVAVDPLNRATVVWSAFDGSDRRIQTVQIAPDGTPGAVHTLSAPGENAFAPQVAVDSGGRATVVWYLFNGSNVDRRIQEARIRTDGTPGGVHTLAGPETFNDKPQVAIDSRDRATVVWQHADDGTNARAQAVRIAADGTPGAVHYLSAPGLEAHAPEVAIDSHDRATVVWQATASSASGIQSVRIRADGTQGAVRDLSAAGRVADTPQVAVDSRGRATVVWNVLDGTRQRIQSRRINVDGTLDPIHNLSPAGRQASGAQVGIDSNDRATVIWQRHDESSTGIQAVRIPPNGAPGTVQDLSVPAAGRIDFEPRLAVDPQGTATVVWRMFDGMFFRIQAVRIRANGSPGWVKTLSAPEAFGVGPEVADGPQGRPTAVWDLDDQVSDPVQFSRGS
jgi:hypothetical protein